MELGGTSLRYRNRSETDLRDAFIALDTNPQFRYPDGVSFWDKQNQIHEATHVHAGPAFLSWHRELCNRLEGLLRQADPVLSLHYWDWTTDPRSSPDGAGGVVNLFSAQFMGSSNGDVGLPFQNPATGVFFETTGIPNPSSPITNPPFPIWRQVDPGLPSPGTVSDFKTDQQMVIVGDNLPDAQQYPTFRVAVERMHNSIHGYLGGTVGGDPHHAFHDPFVFLLHSNVDRLWAVWQRAPGREWRLSPDQVYGDDRDKTNLGLDPFGSGEPITAINDNLQPWAGGDAFHAPLRPWTPQDSQIQVKTSRHPSVVIPARYDTDPPGGGDFGPDASANEDWTHGPFFGTRGTFFADVTGDGRADAIVINDDTVTVRRAT
jgi:hypothetical protein